MILTNATTPDEYVDCLEDWQKTCIERLRGLVTAAVPEFEERLKWGHLVYFLNGPTLLLRFEPNRVLFGFWRGQRLREIESRLKPGGKYEMATMTFDAETTISDETVIALAVAAAELNRSHGDPTNIKPASG